jgi:ketosteroid isomerase-like protein
MRDRQDELDAMSRVEIGETISMHGHLFDEGHLDRLDELFTADVVYDLTDVGMKPLYGIAEIRQATLDLGAGNPLAHHVTNIVVSDLEDDRAAARCKALAVMSDGRCASATYVDALRRENGRWRICRRTVLVRRTPLSAGEQVEPDEVGS